MAQCELVQLRLTDRILDLDSLEVLRTVADSGSLSAAAARLRITQQAVSARIAAIERAVGLQLVVRSTSGSHLTDSGSAVLDLGRPVLEASARLEAGVAALRLPAGTITVAASQTIAELLLPDWLLQLRRALPEVTVRLTAGNSSDVLGRVRSGLADLGFVEGPDVPEDLRSVPVADDELTVVVAPFHPWASRRSVTAEDLAATAMLVRERGSGTRAVLETWLRGHGLRLHEPEAEFDTSAVIRANGRAGVAPAVMSVRSIAEDVQVGLLVRIPVEPAPPMRHFAAVWAGDLGPLGAAFLRIAERTGS